LFVNLKSETKNMNFLGSDEKHSEKKSASIFPTVGSRETHENTDQKVGLRQSEILKFEWLN
jgi:hypothetical protein